MSAMIEERDQTRVRLADGVELLGTFEGSGCQEAPHLVRRKDGQSSRSPACCTSSPRPSTATATVILAGSRSG